jgi:microcystin-dependent protein
MANPFLGEIRAFGFYFAPQGWATCSGQILPITQNTALFSLLGTTFGGDGRSNFALPNLGGQAALHAGSGPGLTTYDPGEQVGSAAVTLNLQQLPAHTHSLNVQNASAGVVTPQGSVLAKGGTDVDRQPHPYSTYVAATPNTPLSSNSIGPVGGNQAHENRQPSLSVNFCIALSGVFPSRP